MKHATPAIRNGCPALNVKDRTLWARHADAQQAYAELAEDQIEALYEEARERFWSDADLLATEAGYNFHQDGRSGGWLVVTGTHFLDYIDAGSRVPFDLPEGWHVDLSETEVRETIGARDAFLRFAQEIDTAMDQAGDYFLELLSEAVAELHAARENAIVRGEN